MLRNAMTLIGHSMGSWFVFSGIIVNGQINTVVTPMNTTVCFQDSITFTAVVAGAGNAGITYRWQKNHIDIAGTGSADSCYSINRVSGSSAGMYRCIVNVEGFDADTSNDAILAMHPRMYIDSLFRYNSLGCPGECRGQYKAVVSGGTPYLGNYGSPYIYDWYGGYAQDTLVFGLCPGHHPFTVTDSVGCSIDSTYFVDALLLPKVKLGIIIEYPTLHVRFQDSIRQYLVNWMWNFGDNSVSYNTNPVSHTYGESGDYELLLSFTDLNGCDSTIYVWIHNWPWDVEDAERNERISAFPNPFSSLVTMEFIVQERSEVELAVYDIYGRRIKSLIHDQYINGRSSIRWDGTNDSERKVIPGIYLMKFQCGNSRHILKIIYQN